MMKQHNNNTVHLSSRPIIPITSVVLVLLLHALFLQVQIFHVDGFITPSPPLRWSCGSIKGDVRLFVGPKPGNIEDIRSSFLHHDTREKNHKEDKENLEQRKRETISTEEKITRMNQEIDDLERYNREAGQYIQQSYSGAHHNSYLSNLNDGLTPPLPSHESSFPEQRETMSESIASPYSAEPLVAPAHPHNHPMQQEHDPNSNLLNNDATFKDATFKDATFKDAISAILEQKVEEARAELFKAPNKVQNVMKDVMRKDILEGKVEEASTELFKSPDKVQNAMKDVMKDAPQRTVDTLLEASGHVQNMFQDMLSARENLASDITKKVINKNEQEPKLIAAKKSRLKELAEARKKDILKSKASVKIKDTNSSRDINTNKGKQVNDKQTPLQDTKQHIPKPNLFHNWIYSSSPQKALFSKYDAPVKTKKTTSHTKTPLKRKITPRGVTTISQWKKNHDNSISGVISNSGSRSFGEGEPIITSPSITNPREGTVIKTISGSRYYLGRRNSKRYGIMRNAASKSQAKAITTEKYKKNMAKLSEREVEKRRMPVKKKNKLESKKKHNIDSSILSQFGKAVLKEDILFQTKVDKKHIPIQKPVISNISDLRKTKKHSNASLKQKTPTSKLNGGTQDGMTKAKVPNMMFDLWSNSKIQNNAVQKNHVMKTVESETDEKKNPKKKGMNPIWSAVNFCIDQGAEFRLQLDAKSQKESGE